jgi:hypothetical protein
MNRYVDFVTPLPPHRPGLPGAGLCSSAPGTPEPLRNNPLYLANKPPRLYAIARLLQGKIHCIKKISSYIGKFRMEQLQSHI